MINKIIHFIKKVSKEKNEYINIYKILDYSPFLSKIAYIDKGLLFTY